MFHSLVELREGFFEINFQVSQYQMNLILLPYKNTAPSFFKHHVNEAPKGILLFFDVS